MRALRGILHLSRVLSRVRGGAAAEEPVRSEIAICGWARFIYAWHGVSKEVMPLQEQLALAEGKLAEKVSDVARLEELESSKLRKEVSKV